MKGKNGSCCRLHVSSLGLAFGVLWGASVCVVALIAMAHGSYGMEFVNAIGTLYIGYKATWLGSLIGLVWGFIDAFVMGVVLAWLYNYFLCCCKCK